MTNFWRNNWRSIIDVVERLCFCLFKCRLFPSALGSTKFKNKSKAWFIFSGWREEMSNNLMTWWKIGSTWMQLSFDQNCERSFFYWNKIHFLKPKMVSCHLCLYVSHFRGLPLLIGTKWTEIGHQYIRHIRPKKWEMKS